MTKRISVAIVGTGFSGLAALKEFSQAGFDVTAFERFDCVAGIWAYNEDPEIRSVSKNTLINNSKYMFCFSDFPMPDDYPTFVPHAKIKDYCDAYCENFDLKGHIKFRHEVVELQQHTSGLWHVTTKCPDGLKVDIFEKVIIATGKFQTPVWPKVDGLASFKGSITHVANYKQPERYHGRTVLVVGVGNSALDCCVDLANIAKQVYVSGRGIYVFPRISFGGKPADLTVRRSLEASEWMVNLIVRFVGWLYYGNLQRFGFEKPPLPSRVDIAVNGSFVETLASGKVLVRSKLAKVIGPKVVEFRDGATLDGIDDIIMATGYRPEHSFLKDLKYTGQESHESRKAELFRGMISLAAPDSLAFVGRVLNPISITTMELQSRYLVELYKGRVNLPSHEAMQKQIDDHSKWIEKTRNHKDDVDVYLWTSYLDWLAGQIGCDVKSRLTWGLWFGNRTLYNYIAKGPFSGHQFRIWGPGRWDGAIEALTKVNKAK